MQPKCKNDSATKDIHTHTSKAADTRLLPLIIPGTLIFAITRQNVVTPKREDQTVRERGATKFLFSWAYGILGNGEALSAQRSSEVDLGRQSVP